MIATSSLETILVVLVVSWNIVIGALVYWQNRKSRVGQSFFLFTIFITMWVGFAYLSELSTDPQSALLLSQIVYGSVMASAISLFYFSSFFTQKASSKLTNIFILGGGIGVIAISFFTKLVLGGIHMRDGGFDIVSGPLYLPFVALVLVPTGMGIYNFLSKYRNSSVREKSQISYFFLGLGVFVIANIVFNIIVKQVTGGDIYYRLGNYSATFLVGFAAYAILRYHLFNIKVVATELLTFAIWIFLLVQTILATTLQGLIINAGLLILVIFFGVLLIKSVISEIEQREKLEILTRELESANERLVKLDQLKSQFLSFASHQVKTPITVVKGYASLIIDGTYGATSDKVKEVSQKIIDASDRMVSLVNNILNLRKIEEGKMEYSFAPVDTVKLVEAISTELRSIAERKNLALKVNLPQSRLMVQADEEKLRQVIQNLIDNAIKYTEKGWVEVSVEDGNGQVLISVSDSGRGISQELLPKLFEQWSRDSKAAKEIQGTGLGLYIAKEIVTAHKGEIWAESRGEGSGSTFNVRLKLSE